MPQDYSAYVIVVTECDSSAFCSIDSAHASLSSANLRLAALVAAEPARCDEANRVFNEWCAACDEREDANEDAPACPDYGNLSELHYTIHKIDISTEVPNAQA